MCSRALLKPIPAAEFNCLWPPPYMIREIESMLARIAALCLACSGGNRGEVFECDRRKCPLWGLRPKRREGAAS